MRVFSTPALILLLASPALAATAPAGGLRWSAAADGALEVRAGEDLLARVALETPALRRGAPALREVTVDGHRLAELRVPVRGTPSEEVWIGEVDQPPGPPHPRRVLWSGMTGPRDTDGETSQWVDVSEERVVEYQTAASRVDRCDGLPPRLFPRLYDFAAGRFRPMVSLLPPPGGETLIARRGDPATPAGRPIADFHFVGASTTRGAGSEARELTRAGRARRRRSGHVLDRGSGRRRARRVPDRARRGRRLRRARPAHLPGRRRQPAGASAERTGCKRFQLALGPAPGQRFDVEIPDDPAADAAHWRESYWVPLPKPIVSSCVTVVITEVTPGSEAAPPRTTAKRRSAIWRSSPTPTAPTAPAGW